MTDLGLVFSSAAPMGLEAEQVGQRQAAKSQCADLEELPARDAVTGPMARFEEGEHDRDSEGWVRREC